MRTAAPTNAGRTTPNLNYDGNADLVKMVVAPSLHGSVSLLQADIEVQWLSGDVLFFVQNLLLWYLLRI